MSDIIANMQSEVTKRRTWTLDQKSQILAEVVEDGISVVATRHNVSPGLICTWKKKAQQAKQNGDSFEIEDHVPLPVQNNRSRKSFPWADMKPGQSFFAAGYVVRGSSRVGKRISTATARKLHPGSSWVVREEVKDGIDGVRVWRSV